VWGGTYRDSMHLKTSGQSISTSEGRKNKTSNCRGKEISVAVKRTKLQAGWGERSQDLIVKGPRRHTQEHRGILAKGGKPVSGPRMSEKASERHSAPYRPMG